MTTSQGVTEYRYDDFDRLREIVEPDDDVITLVYDRLGRLDTITRPNGVISDWTWNDVRPGDDIVHKRAGASIDELGYEYGDSGLLFRTTDIAGAHLFGYDNWAN